MKNTELNPELQERKETERPDVNNYITRKKEGDKVLISIDAGQYMKDTMSHLKTEHNEAVKKVMESLSYLSDECRWMVLQECYSQASAAFDMQEVKKRLHQLLILSGGTALERPTLVPE